MDALSFATKSRLDSVVYTRETSRGTAYAVSMALTTKVGAIPCSPQGRYIDPEHFRLLEGQDLALRVTENGVRIRPITEQPQGVQNHLIAMLEWGAGHMVSAAPIPHIKAEPPVEDRNDPPEARHGERGTPLPRLAELAVAVAQQAAELGLPTAMWVHLPSE